MKRIVLTVNGSRHEADVEPRTLLVHFLREQLDLTGTNVGCDTSPCGLHVRAMHAEYRQQPKTATTTLPEGAREPGPENRVR